jgi:isoquinoline 1-oxidoreductase beta subunit
VERAGAECSAANSVITHKPSGRTITYGKVADAAAKLDVPPKDVPLKDPKDWKIAGKPLKRLDTADKLTGKQIYGIDLKLPGMLTPRSRPARCSAASSRASTPPKCAACPA